MFITGMLLLRTAISSHYGTTRLPTETDECTVTKLRHVRTPFKTVSTKIRFYMKNISIQHQVDSVFDRKATKLQPAKTRWKHYSRTRTLCKNM